MKPRLAILSAYLSGNMMGRAYVLYELAREDFDAFIVAPDYGRGLWTPLRGMDLPLHVVDATHISNPLVLLAKLAREAKADLLLASKPLFTSFGVGLLARKFYGVPLILDLDDADLPARPKGLFEALKSLRDVRWHHWWWYTALLSLFIKRADALCVASRTLEKLYGADLYVPHSRSAKLFDPALYPKPEAKRALGLQGKRTVMFLGTPRPHKGLEQLAEAVGRLPEDVILVYIAGARYPALFASLERLARGRTLQLEPFSFQRLPEVLAAADVVALPQQPTVMALAQTPAKVFDAMAMAKPVVTTKVGDLPEILAECGLVVDFTPESLASALQQVLEDEALAARMGELARQRFLERYSFEANQPAFVELLKRVLAR